MNVFFYFDGSAGRGLLGRRARKLEKRGFDRCALVRRVWRAARADVVYVRNIPERTTDLNLARMDRFLRDHQDKVIINHPRSALLHDSKDRTFAAWAEAGLRTPEWTHVEHPDRLAAFVARHPSVLLRVNNSACGCKTAILHQPGAEEIRTHHRALVASAELERKRHRSDSRPVAVEMIDSRDKHGLYRVHRVFVVAGKVYGGYALVSRTPLVSFATSTCATDDEQESFLDANAQLDLRLHDPHFAETLTKAAATLDLQVTCIDVLLVDDDIILLEANPLWSPSLAWAGGGEGKRRYLHNRELFHERAGNYCAWMDRARFYEGMYSLFDRF